MSLLFRFLLIFCFSHLSYSGHKTTESVSKFSDSYGSADPSQEAFASGWKFWGCTRSVIAKCGQCRRNRTSPGFRQQDYEPSVVVGDDMWTSCRSYFSPFLTLRCPAMTSIWQVRLGTWNALSLRGTCRQTVHGLDRYDQILDSTKWNKYLNEQSLLSEADEEAETGPETSWDAGNAHCLARFALQSLQMAEMALWMERMCRFQRRTRTSSKHQTNGKNGTYGYTWIYCILYIICYIYIYICICFQDFKTVCQCCSTL